MKPFDCSDPIMPPWHWQTFHESCQTSTGRDFRQQPIDVFTT